MSIKIVAMQNNPEWMAQGFYVKSQNRPGFHRGVIVTYQLINLHTYDSRKSGE